MAILFRVSFELEPGAGGQTTDFKEGMKRLEWCLKKARLISNYFTFLFKLFMSVTFDHLTSKFVINLLLILYAV